MSDARLDRAVHLALLAVAAVTAGMVAAGYTGPLRPVAALVTAALLPGAAVLALLPRATRAPRLDTPAWTMLACAFSLAVETVCALAMVWLRWWHPAAAAAALGAVAAAVVAAHLIRDAQAARATRATPAVEAQRSAQGR